MGGRDVILIQKGLFGWRNYSFLHLPDALTGKKKKKKETMEVSVQFECWDVLLGTEREHLQEYVNLTDSFLN